jgi:NAD(P)-dependent dehydrogenase (short-subunit alcohol dehydrogenase family)
MSEATLADVGADMQGKTVLITGTASGMGRIAAKRLADLGAQLILVDFDVPNGEGARDEIIRDTGNDALEFIDCDVTDFDQVRRMCAHVSANYERLDVVINNAGITETVWRESVNGFEMTMATNFLGAFLICHLLRDKLIASAPSRLINICSDAHKMVKALDFDDLDNRVGWNGVNHNKGFQAYARSKLCLAAVSYRLVEEFHGTGVDVHTVSPGYFIRTNIHRHMRGIWKLGVKLFWPVLQSPYRAARTYVYLASAPEVTGDTGHYWEHMAHKESSPASHDANLQQRIWDYAVRATAIDTASTRPAGAGW